MEKYGATAVGWTPQSRHARRAMGHYRAALLLHVASWSAFAELCNPTLSSRRARVSTRTIVASSLRACATTDTYDGWILPSARSAPTRCSALPSRRSLWVTSNDFTEEGVQSLTRQLRTNTQMFELDLRGSKDDSPASLEQALGETVRAYNYTLRRVHLNRHQFFPTMRRNRWIRTAVRRLEPWDYRVAPVGLWPHAFGTMSAFPTLLYRLLRRGDVDALCDAVVHHRPQPKGTKRGRAAGNCEDPGRS
jgi:hypothetical protein